MPWTKYVFIITNWSREILMRESQDPRIPSGLLGSAGGVAYFQCRVVSTFYSVINVY